MYDVSRLRVNIHCWSYLSDFCIKLAVYEMTWKDFVEPDRPQMTIWRMHIACWIPKATNANSEYVILIAFPLQQWLHERAPMLRYTYIAFLVVSSVVIVHVTLRSVFCMYRWTGLSPHSYNSVRPGTHYPHVTWAHVMLSRAVGMWEAILICMAQIHTSVTLLTLRDLARSSGRLTCQHASQISAVVHISWDVTYVSSALQTLPVVSRNGGNSYWKSAPTDLFIWHQVTRL